MATVVVPRDPSSQEDSKALRSAFKGFGCNDKKVVEILGHRNAPQRYALAQAYRALYGEELTHRLKSELHSSLEKAVLLWMMEPVQRDVHLVKNAVRGLGTRSKALIDVLCTRTPTQLQLIKKYYFQQFGVTLEGDIKSDTSGDYEKFLLALLNPFRPEASAVDIRLADAEARELYRAGEGRFGTHEDTFIRVLSTRSNAQLAATFGMYRQLYGHDFEKAVKRETSGQFRKSLRAVIRCVYPATYFALALHKSMKGLGTDDNRLIRLVVTRAEVDMYYIKAEFLKRFGKTLENMISHDTSGAYKQFLLTLVGSG
eukprot:TRINITY_DN45_c0_g1_i1.p1 TRINITY_DN45_c0_g1~~TRINITY_DN45_c0_g1_i1.p1  ORF type:complete len:314 (+),score=46.04 TRINITY_DN45_c0_g1_i1:220-1161(+)